MKIKEFNDEDSKFMEVSFPKDSYLIKIRGDWIDNEISGKSITFQDIERAISIVFTTKQWIEFIQELKENLLE